VQHDNRESTNRLRAVTPSRRTVLIALVVLAAILSIPAVRAFQDVNRAARGSAKSALLKEMELQLRAWPASEDYPASLSELRLTYPDGGDESLLKEFHYSTNGRTCSIRTFIWDRDVVVRFPKDDDRGH
jgi:Tfp pilus assembly protein PilE